MAGRGRASSQKRQKEALRAQKRQEKQQRRQERKSDTDVDRDPNDDILEPEIEELHLEIDPEGNLIGL